MALVLLQLKLAIQRRAFGHSSGWQRAAFFGRWLVALLLGLGAAAAVARVDSARSGGGDLALVLLLSVVFVVWFLVPILMPGISDQTVNPEMLEQYPLTVRQQVSGLLLGALVAPTALFTFLMAAGGTFAAGEAGSARVAVVVAALLFTMLCVTASRSLQAILAGVMTSRKGRDVILMIGGVIGLALYLVSQTAHGLTERFAALEGSTTESVMGWFPPGSAAQVLISVRDGEWGLAALHALVVAAGIVLFAALWAWAIKRRTLGSGGAGRPRTEDRRQATTELRLLPTPLTAFPLGPRTAAAAQQLRYYFFRSPQAMQSLVLGAVMGSVVGHSLAGDGLAGGTVALGFVAAATGAFAVLGFDDRGFEYLVLSGAPLRKVLDGKALASLVFFVPVMALFVVVEAIINDLWSDAVAAFAAGVATLVAGVGIGAVVSVAAPANRTRPGRAGAKQVVWALLGTALLAVPIGAAAFAWLLLDEPDRSPWIAIAATLALAVLVCWGALRWAGLRLARDPARVSAALGVDG